MCTAGNTSRRNGRQEEDEEEEENLPQPETTMAPPLWPPAADVEEDEPVTEATQEDFHIGYVQIADDPSARNASEELAEEEQEEMASYNSLPLVNDAFTEAATNGHAGSLAGAAVRDGRNPLERIVTMNGMQFHVYGNVSGLELRGGSNPIREEHLHIPDSEEEEEEERRRASTERAIEEANAADAARRAAPISPERRAMIVHAMKGINLGGFRPSWADSLPEDQWINKIRADSLPEDQWINKIKESSTSAPHECLGTN